MLSFWKQPEEQVLIQADAADAKALEDLPKKHEKLRPEYNTTFERGLTCQAMINAHDRFDVPHSEFESAYLTGLREQAEADRARLTEITTTMAAELAAVRDRAYQRRALIGSTFATWLGNVEHDNGAGPLGSELAEAQQKIYKLIEDGKPLAEIYAIAKPLVDRIANDKTLRAPILRMPEMA
jgi:hypothetical protein